MADRPHQVWHVHTHDAEHSRPVKDAKGNGTVETNEQDDRCDGIEDITLTHTSVIGHDHHIVFVYHSHGFLLPGSNDFCQAVESVIRPIARNLLTIFISEDTHAMLNIITPLPLKPNPIPTHKQAIPMSDILGPIPSIVAPISPRALAHVYAHPVAVDFSLVPAMVYVNDGHSACG